MIKVVDSNYLTNIDLKKYLMICPDNMVVLCDYVMMEQAKRDAARALPKAMAIVSEYPSQVFYLKSTAEIGELEGHGTRFYEQMFDQEQTLTLRSFLIDPEQLKRTPAKFEDSVGSFETFAKEHMERVLGDTPTIMDGFEEFAATLSEKEMNILKGKSPMTEELFDTIYRNILEITTHLYRTLPYLQKDPDWETVHNTYVFRNVLCIYLLGLDYVREGGFNGKKPAKFRNDIVDMNVVTYSTYFDGLLSSDVKANKVYRQACYLRNNGFSAETLDKTLRLKATLT